MRFERGTVLLLALDPTLGREQRGVRPCVAVSDPDVAIDQRFPLLVVVPLTTIAGTGALYPKLEPGPSGLSKTSYALVDQIRSVDKRRVRRTYGVLSQVELRAIDDGMALFLGLRVDRSSTGDAHG